jgi:hypothetical protein
VKKYILFTLMLLCITCCFAQDTIVKKGWLTESVMEKYYVLKTDKQTKQGLYQATINRETPLAIGNYANNKRIGVWHFYNTDGQLVQNFNYSTQTILYEEPTTELTKTKIAYAFDMKLTDTDQVTKPIKPGGRCFGYINYLRLYRLSQDFYNVDLSQYITIMELLVSPGGRLADIKLHLKSSDFERTTTFSTELINDDDKVFAPATINGKAVLCRIFLRCKLMANGELDLY